MECNQVIIKKELLKLKKIELVEFILNRRLPEKLQEIAVVVEFLLVDECRICRRCTAGEVIPITFYSSPEGVEDSKSFIETEYDSEKLTQVWIRPKCTTMQSGVSSPSKCDIQAKNVSNLTVEENTDIENTNIKLEYTEINEENEKKFSTSFDECNLLVENEQLEDKDDIKATSDTKEQEIFECELCDYKTPYKRYIVRHGLIHSEARPFSCDSCGYRAKTRQRLNIHIRLHNDVNKLLCDQCDYKCCTKTALKNHTDSHPQEIELHCSLCDYKTYQVKDFKWHEKKHSKAKSYQCEICGNIFKNKTSLKYHILQYHTGEKPFQCDICDYTCIGKNILKKHIRRIHVGEKGFSCEFCDYKCFGKNELTIHRRVHTGEKPFNCKQCDYKSTNKNRLRIHERTHTGEKPYSCDVCGYRAAVKANLKLHIKCMHTAEMPFNCKLCDFKTKSHKKLKTHVLIHSKTAEENLI